MRNIIFYSLLIGLLLLLSPEIIFSQKDDEVFIDRIDTIPDLIQINSELPLSGSQYCGPVSASNSLMWMINEGFIKNVKPVKQLEMVKSLGNYMSVSKIGTSPYQFCNGLDQFLKDNNIQYKILEYQGWRPCKGFKSQENVDIKKLKHIFKSKSAIWLNVGWYYLQQDSYASLFKRYGGHWVTLVGFGYDGNKENPNYLIVHDPSKDSGPEFKNEFLLLKKIDSGTLDSASSFNYKGLPVKANSFYRVVEGLNHNIHAEEIVILDGAVVLEIK